MNASGFAYQQQEANLLEAEVPTPNWRLRSRQTASASRLAVRYWTCGQCFQYLRQVAAEALSKSKRASRAGC